MQRRLRFIYSTAKKLNLNLFLIPTNFPSENETRNEKILSVFRVLIPLKFISEKSFKQIVSHKNNLIFLSNIKNEYYSSNFYID